MTAQTRAPIDPNSPRGIAAAAALTEVIASLYLSIEARRRAGEQGLPTTPITPRHPLPVRAGAAA